MATPTSADNDCLIQSSRVQLIRTSPAAFGGKRGLVSFSAQKHVRRYYIGRLLDVIAPVTAVASQAELWLLTCRVG